MELTWRIPCLSVNKHSLNIKRSKSLGKDGNAIIYYVHPATVTHLKTIGGCYFFVPQVHHLF